MHTLWFDPDCNKFTDDYGNYIYNPFLYIKPYIYELFVTKKESMIVKTSARTYVELFYPDEEDYSQYDFGPEPEDGIPVYYYF